VHRHNEMKRMNYLTHVLQVCLSCVLCTSLTAQKQTFVPANDVSFSILTERSNYRAGEQIALKYKITNISNAPLYAPREWESRCPGEPHLWAWFENSSGQHFVPGYDASCLSSTNSKPQPIGERMSKEAVLLRPGEHLDGTLRLDTTLFGLKPGAYRIEAGLSGWAEEKFTDTELSDLSRMVHPLLRGEVPASMHRKCLIVTVSR
jgi:hypothetical protein